MMFDEMFVRQNYEEFRVQASYQFFFQTLFRYHFSLSFFVIAKKSAAKKNIKAREPTA